MNRDETLLFPRRYALPIVRDMYEYPGYRIDARISRCVNIDAFRVDVEMGPYHAATLVEPHFGRPALITAFQEALTSGARAVYVAAHGCTP